MRTSLRALGTGVVAFIFLAAVSVAEQDADRPVTDTYAESCAACHGAQLQGGRAASLIDDVWMYGGDRDSIVRSIRDGQVAAGMPAYSSAFSDAATARLTEFIRAKVEEAKATGQR